MVAAMLPRLTLTALLFLSTALPADAQSVAAFKCAAPGYRLYVSGSYPFVGHHTAALIDIDLPRVPAQWFAFALPGLREDGTQLGVVDASVYAEVVGLVAERRTPTTAASVTITVLLRDQLIATGGIGDSANSLRAAVCVR